MKRVAGPLTTAGPTETERLYGNTYASCRPFDFPARRRLEAVVNFGVA